MRRVQTVAVLLVCLSARIAAGADEYEQPPIEYSRAAADNRAAELEAAIGRGYVVLRRDERQGYLRDLLARLEIRAESQILVFSKTSLQRDRISPRAPRAIYFNDDVYVGYCQAGNVLEIAAADPQLGLAFYTLDQTAERAPAIVRQTDRCLQCHGSSRTDDVPGLLARSSLVAADGLPILSEGTRRVDHTTPLEHRWGGWYVTGQHGAQQHLGNLVVRDRAAPKPWTNAAGQNVTDLGDRCETESYLTPHSDIVALMVFEHQLLIHNLITKANFAARQALYYEAAMNRALEEP